MPDRSPNAGATAGFVLLSVVLACAGVGLGIGFLLDAPFPLAMVGLFVGFALGFRLVYTRFKDI